jgi:hypothetical protein
MGLFEGPEDGDNMLLDDALDAMRLHEPPAVDAVQQHFQPQPLFQPTFAIDPMQECYKVLFRLITGCRQRYVDRTVCSVKRFA